jgi:hypothetical protein
VFTSFTASGLWCQTCAENVSFRTLTQLDGTEVYLCDICDTEVGQKRTTVLASNGLHAPDEVLLAAQPSSGDEDAYDEGVEGDKSKAIHAGDWCYLLSVDGVRQNVDPYLIAAIETGPDGQQYARFYETDADWLLAQCERTDPPAPVAPPDDVEEFA